MAARWRLPHRSRHRKRQHRRHAALLTPNGRISGLGSCCSTELSILHSVLTATTAHGMDGSWDTTKNTSKQTGAFCTSPNGVGARRHGWAAPAWQPMCSIRSIIPYGRVFIATGNGDFTATTPYAAGMDFGDSILNLDLTNGVPTIQDDFTPMGQAQQDEWDMDQASGGVMLVPTQTTGSYPYLLVQAGKTGDYLPAQSPESWRIQPRRRPSSAGVDGCGRGYGHMDYASVLEWNCFLLGRSIDHHEGFSACKWTAYRTYRDLLRKIRLSGSEPGDIGQREYECNRLEP